MQLGLEGLSEPILPWHRFLRWGLAFVLAPKVLVPVLAPKALVLVLAPKALAFVVLGPKAQGFVFSCVSLSPSPLSTLRKTRAAHPQSPNFSKGAFGSAFSAGLRPQLTLIS